MTEPARNLFAAPASPPGAEFMTVNEVAAMFRVTPTTVRTWIHQGKLDYIKINDRFRIYRDSVQRLAQFNFGGPRG
jgi:excisionase family DNA binding protein